MSRKYAYLVIVLATLAAMAGVTTTGYAQFRGRGFGGGWGYVEDNLLQPHENPKESFTFCRIRYTSVGGGFRWDTDYPDSDINFSMRLSELTTIKVNRDEQGKIQHDIVRITDEKLYRYPFVYMLEVGNLMFSDEEVEILRDYLFRGGFLMVDDFWGDYAWDNFQMQIERVFPPEQYPECEIFDIPLDHEIFNCVFKITEVPQVPAINRYYQWKETGDAYEHNYAAVDKRPHCRGIQDKDGRLMVVIMHNTDLGDGWEREAEHPGYFEEFSVKRAYPMGINIVTYAMTH